MKEMSIKNGWILLLLYFITTATGVILISLLAVALCVFAGTAYLGGDPGELVKSLADAGITENHLLLIVQIARAWLLIAPCGFLIFGAVELYSYLCERRKTMG